jgi:putative sterol carrier protein
MAGIANPKDMQSVLAKWVEKLANDPKIAKASDDLEVTIAFKIDDYNLQVHTEFLHGKVTGGLGEAEPPSMVVISMANDTFDGLWTGEVDAEAAAMSGEMSFAGEMNAAMGLQALYEDLARLYIESKTELGVS